MAAVTFHDKPYASRRNSEISIPPDWWMYPTARNRLKDTPGLVIPVQPHGRLPWGKPHLEAFPGSEWLFGINGLE